MDWLRTDGGAWEPAFYSRPIAHGFLTLAPDCEIASKVDAYYAPEADGGSAWNDPELAIDWPLNGLTPVLSDKDRALPTLAHASSDFPCDGNPLQSLEPSRENYVLIIAKILVTGGAGFIGSALVRHLIHNTTHRILNIDLLTYAGNLSSLDAVSCSNRYSFERIDICDTDS